MVEAIFIVAAVMILAGAFGVVMSRNTVHSALFLVQTLIGTALIFLIQEAHFLAAVQIIVYAGAVVILFLFVIMLLGVDKADNISSAKIAGQRQTAVLLGSVIVSFLFAVMLTSGMFMTETDTSETGTDTSWSVLLKQERQTSGEVDGGTITSAASGVLLKQERALKNGVSETDVERLGRILFSEYAFAVEITAVLLTIAVVGAVVLTRADRKRL